MQHYRCELCKQAKDEATDGHQLVKYFWVTGPGIQEGPLCDECLDRLFAGVGHGEADVIEVDGEHVPEGAWDWEPSRAAGATGAGRP